MKRWLRFGALIAVGLVAITELAARAAFDFPLYGADSDVGYWLLPDQKGTFLFRNDWAFDGDSLGVAEPFAPSHRPDILLVGDSIVYGGNEFRQADKLGPLLETRTGWQVWPAAAGSWALQNQMAFLRRKPQLVHGADLIVFVLNGGDFNSPAEWRSPFTHPLERPTLYLPYVFRRYALNAQGQAEAPFPVLQRDVLADWLSFAHEVGKPLVAVAYSDRSQAGQACSWVPESFRQVGEWSCFDGTELIGPSGFRDEIHPSIAGNEMLAEHIETVLRPLLAAN